MIKFRFIGFDVPSWSNPLLSITRVFLNCAFLEATALSLDLVLRSPIKSTPASVESLICAFPSLFFYLLLLRSSYRL